MDYSTINLEELRKLPKVNLAPSYRLSDSLGSGCAGDPPGYPTYFLQSVYTRNGNTPGRGPTEVIREGVAQDDEFFCTRGQEDNTDQHDLLMRRLWLPLPLDHPRTRMWIHRIYQHFQSCYADAEWLEYGRPGTLIFPVPYYALISKGAYLLEQEMVETPSGPRPKWHPEYLEAENKARQILRDKEIERAKAIATPDNHKAVIIIRRFYPEHQPDLALIANPGKGNTPQWWETEAEQPTPETCAKTQRWSHKHPMNGSWCQWCGWEAS